jgi:RNA polymerase sigma factor (sigma-70 family)
MTEARQRLTRTTAARGAGDADGADDAVLITESLRVPERFGVLFDRHAPAIYRYTARRLGRDAADDLVAEIFLAAFQRRGHYDPARADARPWLYGIATRVVARHRRDEVRFFRAIARTGVDPAVDPAPLADQVADRVTAQAARGQLAAAIAGLPAPQRDVLLLTASGLGYPEIAEALGIPAGTVSSRLARARQKVRGQVSGLDPAHD